MIKKRGLVRRVKVELGLYNLMALKATLLGVLMNNSRIQLDLREE